MKKVKACGVFLFRQTDFLEFLLMKHADRWDLPKGHMEKSETELECALRELQEETGIRQDQIRLDPKFLFKATYVAEYKRFKFKPVKKTLVLFMARLTDATAAIKTEEHIGYQWHRWSPPHQIQTNTIDPLLRQVEVHLGDAL